MEKSFSIEESLRFGWEVTRKNSGLLIQIVLTLLAIQVASSIVSRVLEGTALGTLAGLVLAVIAFIVGTGFTLITLKLARGQSAQYSELIPPLDLVWNFFLASVIAGVLIFIGFILLIIPGLYLLTRFSMVRFSVLDGSDPMDSLKASTALTDGHKWKILGFFLVVIGINILGAIPFGLGLLITVPLSMIAYAHVYQKLGGHPHAAHGHSHEHPHHDHEHHDHSHE